MPRTAKKKTPYLKLSPKKTLDPVRDEDKDLRLLWNLHDISGYILNTYSKAKGLRAESNLRDFHYSIRVLLKTIEDQNPGIDFGKRPNPHTRGERDARTTKDARRVRR